MARTVVGLDIGSTGIRAVEVKGSGTEVSIRQHATAVLPPGAVERGVIAQPHLVSEALRLMWEDAKFSTNQVILGVGGDSVLARVMDLDWMPEEDLRASLRYQIEDQLPVPVDDANIDHIYLGEHTVPSDGTTPPRRMTQIMLVATARDAVDTLVRAAQGAKLQPVGADLSSLALVRASVFESRSASAGSRPTSGVQAGPVTEAVLDIGVDRITVAVHTDGRPHLIRVMPGVGGALLTRTLMEETGRDWGAAEQTKCSGIPLPAPGSNPASQEQAVLDGATARLLREARNTMEFHADTDPDNFPSRVLVYGDTSQLPGLMPQIEDALGIPAEPFGSTAVRGCGGPDQMNFALPLGLCMEMTA